MNKAIQALRDGALAVAKRRFRNGSANLVPCWCEVGGVNCVGQPQCHEATNALKEIEIYLRGQANVKP